MIVYSLYEGSYVTVQAGVRERWRHAGGAGGAWMRLRLRRRAYACAHHACAPPARATGARRMALSTHCRSCLPLYTYLPEGRSNPRGKALRFPYVLLSCT